MGGGFVKKWGINSRHIKWRSMEAYEKQCHHPLEFSLPTNHHADKLWNFMPNNNHTPTHIRRLNKKFTLLERGMGKIWHSPYIVNNLNTLWWEALTTQPYLKAHFHLPFCSINDFQKYAIMEMPGLLSLQSTFCIKYPKCLARFERSGFKCQ